MEKGLAKVPELMRGTGICTQAQRVPEQELLTLYHTHRKSHLSSSPLPPILHRRKQRIKAQSGHRVGMWRLGDLNSVLSDSKSRAPSGSHSSSLAFFKKRGHFLFPKGLSSGGARGGWRERHSEPAS